jgi:hypothetical protein
MCSGRSSKIANKPNPARPPEVDAKLRVDVPLGHGLQWGGEAAAGVGEQDVEAPVPALDFLENRIEAVGRLQVGPQRQHTSPARSRAAASRRS